MSDYLSRAGKIFFIAITVVLAVAYVKGLTDNREPEIVYVQKSLTFEDLLDAIEYVESGGDPEAIGDNGNAVGSFQIWKIYVDDVNRINAERAERQHYGFYPYTYEWRTDRNISRDMVSAYLRHYATMKRIGRKPTFEDMARIHNGGPNGWKKDCTKPYWEKVKRAIEGR